MEKIGNDRYTQVYVLDDKNEVNEANHVYDIQKAGARDDGKLPAVEDSFAQIKFQQGAIGEAGVNGCHNEDLLQIVVHRLQSFQKSKFSCRENAIALTKIEEALLWLGKRTSDRESRGVEGTHTV